MQTYHIKSDDGGRSFSAPSLIGSWGHETNLAVLSPTEYLATIRYQPLAQEVAVQGDDLTPEGHVEALKARQQVSKVVFVSSSHDAGRSWSKNRQVTTGGGQCHAHAVGLADGTAVLVSDHRYPRPMSGARALVSRDGGEVWEDEVYYLNNVRRPRPALGWPGCDLGACAVGQAIIAGFARTISLDGREMLTLTGYCNPQGGFEAWQDEGDTPGWDNSVGQSHFQVIRWALEQ